MDIIEATMAGIMLAREIIQLINSNKEITEEELAVLIASGLLKLDSTVQTIKAEMAKYGA